MANEGLKKLNYQIGRICRIGSRKLKLMAVNNRRKQQLRHLGERIYILKTLQQDDNIWDKDEIAQLLLTIADLDQEIEMIIDEINEIKAETQPAETPDESSPAPAAPAEETKPTEEAKPAEEAKPEETKARQPEAPAAAAKPAPSPARKSAAKSGTTKTGTKKTTAKTGQKRNAPAKKSAAKTEKAEKADK